MKKQNKFAIDLTKVDTLILDKDIYEDEERYKSILNDFENMGFSILKGRETFAWAKVKSGKYRIKDADGTPYTENSGDIEVVKIPYVSKTLVINVFDYTDTGKLYQSDTITYSCENYSSIERAYSFVKKLNDDNQIIYVDNDDIVFLETNKITKDILNNILELDTEIFVIDKDANKKSIDKLISMVQNKYKAV